MLGSHRGAGMRLRSVQIPKIETPHTHRPVIQCDGNKWVKLWEAVIYENLAEDNHRRFKIYEGSPR